MKALYGERSRKTYYLLICFMVISKEDPLFKIRPKRKVNVQLCWISLFSKSTWIKTTASGLSYGEKKQKKTGNWDIKKNGHSTFHTDKPGNFDILREVI